MRREWIDAERHQAVRAAASAWRESGLIDEPTRRAIAELYPDDRERLGIAWRILLGGFTLLAAGAAYGFLVLLFTDETVAGLLAILFGLVLTAATEALKGPLRRSQGGIEEATAIAAVGFLLAGAAWLLVEALGLNDDVALPLILLMAGLLGGAALVRWGQPVFAVLAAVSFFLVVARLPAGRWLWLAAAIALAPLCDALSRHPRLAPSHRRGALLGLALALVAGYLAIHLGSVDTSMVEELGGRRGASPLLPRPLAAAATAVYPLACMAWGIAGRRRVPLALGGGLALASLATLARYVWLGPPWLQLLLAGLLLLAAATALRRWLDSGPGSERRGFTAAPFGSGPERPELVEIAAALATLAPEARAPAPERATLRPADGEFGGGGASSTF